MRTRTKILTTVAAGAVAAGAFAAGAAADDGTSADARRAREAMHAEMGGDLGAGMMSGDRGDSMQAMHDAMDPAAMDAMHDQMVDLLPPGLRAEANALHESMSGAMTGGGVDHESHHPAGS